MVPREAADHPQHRRGVGGPGTDPLWAPEGPTCPHLELGLPAPDCEAGVSTVVSPRGWQVPSALVHTLTAPWGLVGQWTWGGVGGEAAGPVSGASPS